MTADTRMVLVRADDLAYALNFVATTDAVPLDADQAWAHLYAALAADPAAVRAEVTALLAQIETLRQRPTRSDDETADHYRAEVTALNARIEAALALCDEADLRYKSVTSAWSSYISTSRVRAALAPPTATEENP